MRSLPLSALRRLTRANLDALLSGSPKRFSSDESTSLVVLPSGSTAFSRFNEKFHEFMTISPLRRLPGIFLFIGLLRPGYTKLLRITIESPVLGRRWRKFLPSKLVWFSAPPTLFCGGSSAKLGFVSGAVRRVRDILGRFPRISWRWTPEGRVVMRMQKGSVNDAK